MGLSGPGRNYRIYNTCEVIIKALLMISIFAFTILFMWFVGWVIFGEAIELPLR